MAPDPELPDIDVDSLPQPSPGVVRASHASPADAARALAALHDAVVVDDPVAALDAVRDRLDALRVEQGHALAAEHADDVALALAGDAAADASLVASDDVPIVTPAQIAELRGLADEMGRIMEVQEATHDQYPARLAQKLSASTGLAVHPEALRQAADRALAARSDLEQADAALAALDTGPGGDHPLPPDTPSSFGRGSLGGPITDLDTAVTSAEPSDDRPDTGIGDLYATDDTPAASAEAVDERARRSADAPAGDEPDHIDEEERKRRREQSAQALAIGLAVASVGLALLLTAQFDAPVSVALVPVAAALAFGVFTSRRGREADEHEVDTGIASSHLAAAGAAVDDRMGGREAEPTSDGGSPFGQTAAGPEQRTLLLAKRDSAEERLRAAMLAWEALAGPDVPPDDIDDLIRRTDPQANLADGWQDASPTLRAVDSRARRLRAKWRVSWAALGLDAPPIEHALDSLEAVATSAAAAPAHPPASDDRDAAQARQAARQRLGSLVGHEAVDAFLADLERERPDPEALARPLVLVDPYRDRGPVEQQALDAELAVIPLETRVLVIEAAATGGGGWSAASSGD